MRQALDLVAGILTDGRADAIALPRGQLRYAHTQAVRGRLAERHQPATVNKTLAAVRGALKEAWRLGLIEAGDYHRAVDLRGISAHTLPRCRALSTGEIRALFAVCAADRSPAGARAASAAATSARAQRVRGSRCAGSTARAAPSANAGGRRKNPNPLARQIGSRHSRSAWFAWSGS